MGEHLRAAFARQRRTLPMTEVMHGEQVPIEPAEPITALTAVEVNPVRQPDGTIRVEVSLPACGLRLLSLDPRDASTLAGHLVSASARAGWYSRGDPGE